MSLRPLQAAFFDMDGLIIDTETLDFRAWQETLAEHGYALRMEHWLGVVGTWGGFEGMYDAVGVEQSERQGIRDAKRGRFIEMVRANLDPLPGFASLHADLRARDVLTAVVSTASRNWVDIVLGEMGIVDDFHFTLSGDDAENGKPAPDLYVLACERARAQAAACVVFEDSAHGVRAAVDAGIPAVAVPNGITSAQSFDHASARVDSLEAVDSALLERLGLALPPVA